MARVVSSGTPSCALSPPSAKAGSSGLMHVAPPAVTSPLQGSSTSSSRARLNKPSVTNSSIPAFHGLRKKQLVPGPLSFPSTCDPIIAPVEHLLQVFRGPGGPLPTSSSSRSSGSSESGGSTIDGGSASASVESRAADSGDLIRNSSCSSFSSGIPSGRARSTGSRSSRGALAVDKWPVSVGQGSGQSPWPQPLSAPRAPSARKPSDKLFVTRAVKAGQEGVGVAIRRSDADSTNGSSLPAASPAEKGKGEARAQVDVTLTVPVSRGAAQGTFTPPPFESSMKRQPNLNPPRQPDSVATLPRVHPDKLQYEAGVLGAISERTMVGAPADFTVDPSRSGMGYLRRILTSRVYDLAVETPLDPAPRLSERLGVQVLLKREDMQQVFSFKLRGAYNMMAQLPPEALARGVITSSAGNHAQGVALSARHLGCSAVICMPVTTPEIKWRSVERLGATVVLVGDSYDETQAYTKKRADEEGRVFIPPFDHPDVIAGQGTCGMEILRQHPGPLHAIFVPVGGGGLLAGIAAYVKRLRPEVRVIGVEPSDANGMALSLYMGQRVMLEQVGGFADGVAVKMVGQETFRISRELVDGIVLVNRDAICAAIKDMFEETRSILEPAGALALAGAAAYCRRYGLSGEAVVAVASGANMNFDRLRLVTELANVGLRSEVVLATTMPEEPGAFRAFCKAIGPDINITEFKYRHSGPDKAHVLYSVGLHKPDELAALQERLQAAGMETLDMSGNDIAKDHLRHLVGGRASLLNEAVFRFVFPERPGALLRFLDAFCPRWNLTLFHYRSKGEMSGNALVGMQVSAEDNNEFLAVANSLGYEYTDERDNAALAMFIQ